MVSLSMVKAGIVLIVGTFFSLLVQLVDLALELSSRFHSRQPHGQTQPGQLQPPLNPVIQAAPPPPPVVIVAPLPPAVVHVAPPPPAVIQIPPPPPPDDLTLDSAWMKDVPREIDLFGSLANDSGLPKTEADTLTKRLPSQFNL